VGSGGPKAWWMPARRYSGPGRIPLRDSNICELQYDIDDHQP
jgi:hypothetical protein